MDAGWEIPGYWSMRNPEKVRHRASYGLFFRPVRPKVAMEAFLDW